jgi:predicted esterase
MTKEDRLTEIDDQLQYLDSLLAYLQKQLSDTSYKIHVLGFSQGVATAWRWLMLGKSQVDSLTLWAGQSPREYPDQGMERLNKMKLFAVVGKNDPFVTKEKAEQEHALLMSKFTDIQAFTFEGKHEMNPAKLLEIAAMLRN